MLKASHNINIVDVFIKLFVGIKTHSGSPSLCFHTSTADNLIVFFYIKTKIVYWQSTPLSEMSPILETSGVGGLVGWFDSHIPTTVGK